MPGIIDSFFIALGFKVDSSGLAQVKREAQEAKTELLSMGTALTGLVAGLAIHKVAEIGSAFEQNKIQIAGFLSALGLSSDFNAGLVDAEGIIAKITADAARLPGEAEEYVEVFKTNAAYLKKGLPGADASQIADWTNKLTAVAKTVASTMDAAQIARESAQLLATTGRAGGHNVLWQKLLPFLMQIEGQANITAQSFNAMTQPKRVELLTAAFAKLQPALDASASSFDAMWGAMVSGVKQLTRVGTAGLFEGMKESLAQLNAIFFETNGTMTETGKATVAAIASIAGYISHAFQILGQLITFFRDLSGASTVAKAALAAFGIVLAGMAWSSTIAKLTSLVSGIKLATIGTGLLAAAVFLIGEDLWTFYNGGESVTGLLVSQFAPAVYGVAAAFVLLAFALSPILASIAAIVVAGWFLASNWDDVVGGMKNVWDDFMDGFKEGLNTLQTLGLNKLLPETFTGSFTKTDREGKEKAEGDRHDENYRRNIAILHARHVGAENMSGGDATASQAPVGYASPEAPSAALSGVMSYDPRAIGSGFQAPATVTNNNTKVGDIHIHTPSSDPREHARVVRANLGGVRR